MKLKPVIARSETTKQSIWIATPGFAGLAMIRHSGPNSARPRP